MNNTAVHAAPMSYMDAATAAPPHPVTRQALLAALDDGWADPGRLYHAGRRAARLVDAARATTAEALGVRPDEVTFTAGGTAAAHAAVLGGLAGRRRAGDLLVHSAVEHSAVLHAARRHGTAVEVGVDRGGRLHLDRWRTAVQASGVALAASPAATRPARCSRWTRRPRPAPGRACRCTWTRPSRWATWPSRTAGRC